MLSPQYPAPVSLFRRLGIKDMAKGLRYKLPLQLCSVSIRRCTSLPRTKKDERLAHWRETRYLTVLHTHWALRYRGGAILFLLQGPGPAPTKWMLLNARIKRVMY